MLGGWTLGARISSMWCSWLLAVIVLPGQEVLSGSIEGLSC